MKTYGIRLVCGMPEEHRPIREMPNGECRVQVSEGGLARLLVEDGPVKTEYLLEDCGDFWRPWGPIKTIATVRADGSSYKTTVRDPA